MYKITEIKQNIITRRLCLEKGGKLCSVEKRRKNAKIVQRVVLEVVEKILQKPLKKALLQSNQKQNNLHLLNNQPRAVVVERKVELLQNLANS